MKKLIFPLALLLCGAGAISGQNLVLNENFESQTFPPQGWTVEGTELPDNLDSKAYAHWSLDWNEISGSAIAGSGCAEVMSFYDEGAANIAKQEWLITPAVEVSQGATLAFTFWCNASAFLPSEKTYGRFLVKVSTDDGASWSDLWNVASQEDIEASGLPWPWNKTATGAESNWQKLTPSINLDAYEGQSVKFAFYFQAVLVNNYTSATLAVDDVKVGVQEMEKLPQVEGSTSYAFSNSYIGYLAQSEPMTLRNVGYGTLTISSIEGLDGTDFSTTIDPASVALARGEELTYRVNYNPTVTGARSTVMKINTNGGTLSVDLSGTKVVLEEGYTLESFEGEIFPPAGWSRNEGWRTIDGIATSGVKSVTVGGMTTCDIVSPRLDLSAGNAKVKFDYLEATGEEYIDDSFLPTTYFICYYKKGSDTDWTELWCSLDDSRYNEWVQKEIEIKDKNGNFVVSDDVYLRWTYEFEIGDGGLDNMVVTDIYFDNVVLPKLYGEGGVPMEITVPSPVNGETDVDYSRLTLSWEPELFAEGYELSVGTDRENPTSLLNQVRLEGNTSVSYTIPELTPATTYYWRVVPYNSVGKNEEGDTWSFTTMADQSIRNFPYTQDFEAGVMPPMGWQSNHQGDGIQQWKINEIGPFAGEYSASVWHNGAGEESTLVSPEIALPESGDMVASFAWGGALCNRLEYGYENEAVTEVPFDQVDDTDGTLYFEIRATDADEWTPLAYTQDRTKWRHKYVSLAAYAGKSVNLRWRFVATKNAGSSTGGSLDEIYVGDIAEMPTLAVEEVALSGLSVYPNPTTDNLYWTGGTANVRVYDLAGNCVKEAADVESISMRDLSTGIYLVTVVQGDTVVTTRVMKR
ncbi:choice-of-anchor J domain-containing protein [Barnesiella sp. An55]|uniref:T9SS-dependent choice-of-anchor J family protein n=1 Tax=Barnesiella sp. An55 TaxID=1965646 RepID=UPI00130283EC|nr:choice-of-anchor J domain-containing protein [Barnesiella sp. An55]HIZ26358.1 choice-of-anchor J domain-containing protein [Candidatus Barnesiella merdipullorum]